VLHVHVYTCRAADRQSKDLRFESQSRQLDFSVFYIYYVQSHVYINIVKKINLQNQKCVPIHSQYKSIGDKEIIHNYQSFCIRPYSIHVYYTLHALSMAKVSEPVQSYPMLLSSKHWRKKEGPNSNSNNVYCSLDQYIILEENTINDVYCKWLWKRLPRIPNIVTNDYSIYYNQRPETSEMWIRRSGGGCSSYRSTNVRRQRPNTMF
jgi:hypothetical protein